ncbi:MAG: dihydrolipoyl dehydrogenase, partial [Alphaproteobacteria bacterium]|nr:dihydrolipoyl dehydrogenase [Alphaproteobacteria bacterium]
AHKASHEAVICIEKIAGVENVKPLDYENIPSCIYCNPQVASMGLTEKQAVEKGYNVKVGNFPYAGNGKAVAIGEPKGFIKTVFDADTDKILGVHMVGAEVTEMIAGLSIAKDMDATAEAISHVVFPHPSLSETIHESVLHALDKAIHI